MTRQSKGFSVIELLIILVVLIVAGLGGWYVWERNHGKDTTKQSSSNTVQSANKDNDQKQQTTDPSEGGKYLVITEWGVRVPLPSELQGDTEYGIRKNVNMALDSDPGPNYADAAYFASKKLAAVASTNNRCGLMAGGHDDLNDRNDPTSYDGGPGILLSRLRTRAQPYSISDVLINGYWYQARKGSAGTCYQGSDGTKESAFIYAMINALKSVEPLPEN